MRCIIETTIGLPSGKIYGDSDSARIALESHLNPALSRCGQLVGCEGCEFSRMKNPHLALVAMIQRVSTRLSDEGIQF